MSIGFIYRWVHHSKGGSYVGSTVDLRKRRNLHLCLFRTGRHHAKHLQAAWNKDGEGAFTFQVIEEFTFQTDAERRAREDAWLGRFRGSLYNSAPTARSILGLPRSSATREKIRTALLGRKVSQEARRRLAEAWRRRARPSTESIARMVAGRKGRNLTAEHRA